jgi:MFS family permease
LELTVLRPNLFYGWRIVGACFIIASFAWSLGLFGSSVYLQAVTAAYGWSIAEVSSAITTFLFVSAVVQQPVGRSISRWGPRSVLLLGAASMVLAVPLIGKITSLWQLYACFVLLGIGWAALSTTAISTTVAPWFERHQGRSITLAIMGASLGAIAGVPLLLFAVRRLGLNQGLFAVGVVTAVVLFPLIMLVFRYRAPADLGLRRDGDLLRGAGLDDIPGPHIATPLNRRRLFLSTTVAFSLALTIQLGFITHHVTLAEPFLGTAGAGMLVSATGLVSIIGRLYLVRIVDRAPVRRLACQAMLAQTIAMLAIGLFPSGPVLIAASLLYGYAIGLVTTLSPIVIRREFGAEAFGSIYGTSATVIQFASAFGPALVGFLRDALGGYAAAFLVAGAVTALGCACLYLGGERTQAA